MPQGKNYKFDETVHMGFAPKKNDPLMMNPYDVPAMDGAMGLEEQRKSPVKTRKMGYESKY